MILHNIDNNLWYLLAIHEGCSVQRKVDSIVNNIHCRDEQDDDGRHLSPQLLIRNKDRKCAHIDNKSQHPHCDADVACDVQSVSIYHSFSPLTEQNCVVALWPLAQLSVQLLFLSVNTNKRQSGKSR